MKTAVQQPSLSAYRTTDFAQSKDKVYNAVLLYGPCHARQVQKATGMEINSVAGRMNDLLKDERIEKYGTILSETGRTVTAWRVKKPEPKLVDDQYQIL